MKRLLITILMGIIALGPVGAQSRKAVRQAKKDTKVLVKELKADGYKSLDNVKQKPVRMQFTAIRKRI